MQVLYSRCCGIDVHIESVTVCVLNYSGGAEPEIRKKEFATHFKALGNLLFWLFAQKVAHVATESTGVCWKPVWQALEGHFHPDASGKTGGTLRAQTRPHLVTADELYLARLAGKVSALSCLCNLSGRIMVVRLMAAA